MRINIYCVLHYWKIYHMFIKSNGMKRRAFTSYQNAIPKTVTKAINPEGKKKM